MDDLDIQIIKELAVDARLPYRDLADRLSLSVNGAHKRIQQLISKGIIVGFRADITPFVTGGSVTGLYGRSASTDLSSTIGHLGSNECTARIIATGGQFLYVDAIVRTNQELYSYQSFVREVGKIGELSTLAVFSAGDAPQKDPLSRTDYRIINALRSDCRRPLQDVAVEIGSTAKTVKRRIEQMQSNHLVSFTMELVLCSSGDMISIVHAKLRPDRRLDEIIPGFVNRKDPHTLGISASNVEPGLMIFSMWGRNMKELREAEKALNSNDDFEAMFSNLYYDMRLFPTWTGKLIEERAK
ncbi:MAG TPA: AsnC family transcriptional regulator [Methanomassiliicoccales archaeon]|nr:AsnC family transcriptional regulator [Methanomassiliicoccales archaeon]